MKKVYSIGMRKSRAMPRDGRTMVAFEQRRREVDAMSKALLTPTPAAKARKMAAIFKRSSSIATEAQNARVLQILREVGGVTAMELRKHADIQHPPARILGLRKAGHIISGRWVRQVSDLGRTHRTMAYTLIREATQ